MAGGESQKRLQRPVLFIERFRKAIWEYEKVITTTQKMIKASEILSIPIYVTTQNRARLGDTCAELSSLIPQTLLAEDVDKTAFSMWVPQIAKHFDGARHSSGSGDSDVGANPKAEIVMVGIESHICVTQTTLDALREGHKVYVLADGVSSCNRQEIGVALDRLRKEGAVITTSESFLYECMGDAGIPEFKKIAALVKEYNGSTASTLETLLSKI